MGYGVVWIDRDIITHPITQQEYMFTDAQSVHGKQRQVRLCCKLDGHRGSSTRADIAGI